MRQPLGQSGDEVAPCRRTVDNELGQESAKAHSIAVSLPVDPRFFTTVVMPHNGAWLVDQLIARLDHHGEGSKIVASARRGARSEQRIESANAPQCGGVESHVGTGAELSC